MLTILYVVMALVLLAIIGVAAAITNHKATIALQNRQMERDELMRKSKHTA